MDPKIVFLFQGGPLMNNKRIPAKRGHIPIMQDKIPFLEGRPEREYVISHDDIIDLEIILHTNDSIEAIIAELD
jgi:hypothetical protein